jgi:hypothetical protein
MSRRVPAAQTLISIRDYAHAVICASKLDGDVLTKPQAGVLWAQFMVETGGSHCYGWNIGNVKHVDGDGYDYQCLVGTWECYPHDVARALIETGQAVESTNPSHIKAAGPMRTAVIFQPPHPMTCFRVYASLDDAMTHHLAFLRRRFASSWPCVLRGDPDGFAHALKAGRDGIEGTGDDYFTADAKLYAAGMRNYHNIWMRAPAYDEALAKVLAESEAITMPDLPNPPSKPTVLVEFDRVHPDVPLGRPTLDDE